MIRRVLLLSVDTHTTQLQFLVNPPHELNLQVKLCEKMSGWLCDAGWLKMRDCVLREGHLPSDVENDPDLMRLLSDCYICFYTDEENKSEGLSLTRFFT